MEGGFGFLLNNCDTLGDLLLDEDLYLEVGGIYYPLKELILRYDYVAVTEEFLSVADHYSITSKLDLEEKRIADNVSDWEYFEKLFIKRSTIKNVLITIERLLAKAVFDKKNVQQDEIVKGFTVALNDFLEGLN